MSVDSPRADLTAADLDALRRRGLEPEEVERQLALLADPPPPLELVAAATPGNGIELLSAGEHEGLIELWRAAAAAGRVRKLVPASGAASRMFASLSRALDEGTLILAGPTLGKLNTGICVFEAPDEESARRFMEDDPTITSGYATGELRPFKASFLRGR